MPSSVPDKNANAMGVLSAKVGEEDL